MNKFFRYLFLFLSICAVQQSRAQSNMKKMADVSGFKANLLTSTKKARSIECDFTQKKFLEVLEEPVVSKGIFCFKRENLVRWEYSSPVKYLIIINNDKIFVKDDKKTNVIDTKSNKIFKEITDMMMSCFEGNLQAIEKKYSVQYFEDANAYMTRLVPLDKKAVVYVKNIDMYFDKKDMTISKLNIVEPSNDYTEYVFTNKKLNTAISDEKFKVN
jgi:outer membrane lipoprotein-sorting protein